MNKYGFLVIMVLTIHLGCSKDQTQEHSNNTMATDETDCFIYTQAQDTIKLAVIISQNEVSGQLTYDLFEKDSNHGTINGTMKGDTLLAEYTFKSEGVESVREVAFLKNGNDFLALYGDVGEQNGKVVFTDPSALALNERIILKSVPCKNP